MKKTKFAVEEGKTTKCWVGPAEGRSGRGAVQGRRCGGSRSREGGPAAPTHGETGTHTPRNWHPHCVRPGPTPTQQQHTKHPRREKTPHPHRNQTHKTHTLDLAKAFERVGLPVVCAWATHFSFPRKVLRVLCVYFEQQRRVQFEGCVAEPLKTITAVLPGSK